MTTDPSWLYSTIAQSSAAIVAIIGGFITATVLMLTAEKRSLTHQKKDKETRLAALKAEEERWSDVYETMRVDRFFKSIADDLKKEAKIPPLKALIRSNPGWHLDHKILKREYKKLSRQRLEARHFIEQHSDKIDPTAFKLFDEWVKENELDILSYDYGLLEEEYNRFRKREKEILEEERSKATPPQFRGILALQERFRRSMPNFIPPPSQQLMQIKLRQLEKEDRRLENVESRLSILRHEIFLLESEVSDLDERLASFKDPKDLRWGLCVLAYLAGVGILFPVIVIAKEVYFTITEQFAIGLFFSGLIAIFGYIVFQINRLRR